MFKMYDKNCVYMKIAKTVGYIVCRRATTTRVSKANVFWTWYLNYTPPQRYLFNGRCFYPFKFPTSCSKFSLIQKG